MTLPPTLAALAAFLAVTVPARAEAPPQALAPEDLLRRVTAGADTLTVVMREPSPARPGAPRPPRDRDLVTVRGADKVAALLRAVQIASVESNPFTWHTRTSDRRGPYLRFARADKVVAALAFDQSCAGGCAWVLRPYSSNLWSGDARLTETSGKALADWFRRNGYPKFAALSSPGSGTRRRASP